ncbi:hypothetical protein SALBM217S_10424 [Streptomyces griseoloalbus]
MANVRVCASAPSPESPETSTFRYRATRSAPYCSTASPISARMWLQNAPRAPPHGRLLLVLHENAYVPASTDDTYTRPMSEPLDTTPCNRPSASSTNGTLASFRGRADGTPTVLGLPERDPRTVAGTDAAGRTVLITGRRAASTNSLAA